MAKKSNINYLRFNAYSIKDLITKKLTEDTKFTDQVFEGSNLAILIDLVSYMYQVLMYNLNNAAAESMFADTQIYENINRLCQFIGYNPKGMAAGTAVFHIDNSMHAYVNQIPKFTYIDTGKTDSNGKEIYYSTDDVIDLSESDEFVNFTMYNGRWRLYDTVFTASGDDWETFTLDGLESNARNNKFISNNHIQIYVTNKNSINGGDWYKQSNYGLFKSERLTDEIYDETSKIFNLRLDETKTYVITFGDGFRGKKPLAGSLIYIFYLDTNGLDCNLELGEVTGKLKLPKSLNIKDTQFKTMFYGSDVDEITEDADKNNQKFPKYLEYEKMFIGGMVSNKYTNGPKYIGPITAVNITASTPAILEESVDDIRNFAPNWFRMGNRLVTKHDYEYYIKNSQDFKSEIADVVCMNNWEYISTFYKWLYDLGIQKHTTVDESGSRYYLNQNRIIHAKYEYADPADCNNIYLWVSFKGPQSINNTTNKLINSDLYKSRLANIKDLTHEPVFLPAVKVNFAICAAPESVAKTYLKTQIKFDENADSYIEITLDDMIVYTNMSISRQVANIIINQFDDSNVKIGNPVDFNKIQNEIMEINGVKRIRTIYKNPNDDNDIIIRNGLSFASWTANSDLIDVGDDIEVSNSSRTLEPFQLPILDRSQNISYLMRKIKVIKRAVTSINHVQY